MDNMTTDDYFGDQITTESGLTIIKFSEGTGEPPKKGNSVTVHYHGTLEDGTVFSSSIERGDEFTFQFGLGNVIRAWDEAFGIMRAGSKTRLIIPPDLAYGYKGSPDGSIPPNATITFDIDLLNIRR